MCILPAMLSHCCNTTRAFVAALRALHNFLPRSTRSRPFPYGHYVILQIATPVKQLFCRFIRMLAPLNAPLSFVGIANYCSCALLQHHPSRFSIFLAPHSAYSKHICRTTCSPRQLRSIHSKFESQSSLPRHSWVGSAFVTNCFRPRLLHTAP